MVARVGEMKLHGFGCSIAIVVVTIGPVLARDGPTAVDMWDPFHEPVTQPDRIPDDYVNDKPYWSPPPGVPVKRSSVSKATPPKRTTPRIAAPVREVAPSPQPDPMEAMAAD